MKRMCNASGGRGLGAALAGLLLLSAAGCGGGGGQDEAVEGPRPEGMDRRYADRSGDLVADPPEDPSRWQDPRVLVFAYTPVEDPAVYRGVWDEFLAHLGEVTGKRVQFFPIQSNAAQLEAMRAGRLHVTGFNTGSVPAAVNLAGFRPFAMMAGDDGTYGYEMEIIVGADSDIESVEDLRGRRIAFTSPTSNSGYRAPRVLLEQEFGLIEGEDYSGVFSGGHDTSIIGVANRDYDAAAIANEVLFRMASRGVFDENRIRSIYRSETFPTTAYGYAHNLAPELAEKVREAFFTFDWEGTALKAEFADTIPPYTQFIPISYKEHWELVRQVEEAMEGVEEEQLDAEPAVQ